MTASARREGDVASAVDLMLYLARTFVSADAARRVQDLVRQPVDWALLLELAQDHGVAPLVFRTMRLTRPDGVPTATIDLLHDEYHRNAVNSLSLLGELRRLLAALESNGIPAISLKGPALGISAYGDAALRRSLDLDILVRRRDVLPAKVVLRSKGYLPVDQTQLNDAQETAFLTLTSQERFLRDANGTVLELHWRLPPWASSAELAAHCLWEHCSKISVGGSEVRILAPEKSLLLLCVHGFNHTFSCLKWLCDVAELIRSHPAINWERAAAEAHRLGHTRTLLASLLLASDLLDAPVPDALLRNAKADRVVASIAAAVHSQLYSDGGRPPRIHELLREFRLHLKGRARLRDKVQYCLSRPAVHSRDDIAWLPMPASLSSLYRLCGPIRVIRVYGPRIPVPLRECCRRAPQRA